MQVSHGVMVLRQLLAVMKLSSIRLLKLIYWVSGAQFVLPYQGDSQQGQILITSSVYCFVNGMANSICRFKGGSRNLGRCLRTEIAYTGATAGVVYPGWTATPIAKVAFGVTQL